MLIRGATAIDPGSGRVLENACVAIDGDRIVRAAVCDGRERAARVIDGAGAYVVPGLWDMHVHALWDASIVQPFFDDFIAHGVVGVRDMGGDSDIAARARTDLAAGALGPRLVAAGPFVDGPQPLIPPFAIATTTHADGVAAARAVKDAGGDFVKAYTLLPAAAAQGVFDEARALGLPVVGHLPAALNVDDAIAGGMVSLEHMAVGVGGLCDVDDAAACAATFAKLTDAGVYLTPTLVIRERRTRLDQEGVDAQARLDAMPEAVAGDWMSRRDAALAELPPHDWDARRAQFLRERRLTELAAENGARLLAGTDAGDLFVPPGLSLHDELALLVEAGLTPMRALAAATSAPAAFLKLEDQGGIAPGMRADLVLLRADPLADIRNTREIEAVVLGGRLIEAAELACLKSRTCE